MFNVKRHLESKNESGGSMLIELLLSIALAVIVIPFIFKYQQNAIIRAQNIALTNEMTEIQVALERYIVANRQDLLKTVGRHIVRLDIEDLIEFGIPEYIIDNSDKYQLRILKSADSIGAATLQGVIVRDSADIAPMRTREIVNLSGGDMGFIDGMRAHGTFGTWHADTVDIGVDVSDGLVGTTSVKRDNAVYLWRLPSENVADSTMMSALNLGGHDIVNISVLNSDSLNFSGDMSALKIVADKIVFENRTTLDNSFNTASATVSGALSSDGRGLEIEDTLTFTDVAKLSALDVQDLWVSNLTLSGVSIEAEDDFAILKINQALDMTSGRVEAMFVTVGFAGSMTSRLVVHDKIADATKSEYFWDFNSGVANFFDATFVELNRMATLAHRKYGIASTVSSQVFGAVSANKNATVGDYMNAIREIQTRVRGKYRLLNLE